MNFKELRSKLKPINSSKIVMVGLGNSYRSDDNAGQVLLKNIIGKNIFTQSTFVFAGTTPENCLAEIVAAEPEIVIFFDAVEMGLTPGEIREIPPDQVETKGFSTHSYSIKLVENYLKNENIKLFMYIGVEPETMAVGEGLSEKVRKGIQEFFN
ncbi:MAG: hydrogenase maturation protease [Candidatus Marinimicrobia bacterium]|nr:hydrogenase maturation protease [Candidatus Neomarinimicrobiota bacterium]